MSFATLWSLGLVSRLGRASRDPVLEARHHLDDSSRGTVRQIDDTRPRKEVVPRPAFGLPDHPEETEAERERRKEVAEETQERPAGRQQPAPNSDHLDAHDRFTGGPSAQCPADRVISD